MLLASILLIISCFLSGHAAPPASEDINREHDQIKFDIQDIERWKDHIFEAIHSGSAENAQGNDDGSTKSRAPSDITAKLHRDRRRAADITGLEHHKEVHVAITYTIWVGTNVSENYTLLLYPMRNTSFYDVMVLAALVDEHYQFEATEWPYRHYITMLAGHREDPANYLFWLIYQTPQLPDPANPPGDDLLTPVGVDSLFVDEGDNYLFWLRNL